MVMGDDNWWWMDLCVWCDGGFRWSLCHNYWFGCFVDAFFRWVRNISISMGLNEATPFRNCFRFRPCLCGFRCLRPMLRNPFVDAILLSIWLLRRWSTLSIRGLFNFGKTAPIFVWLFKPILSFGWCFLFGFLMIWWCCLPIRFFSTCSNPCRYSLKRIFVNLLSISSTSSTSSDVILRTRLLLLRNVSRLCIISFERIIGIFMPVLLMAVSISHNRFFAKINKYSNALVLLIFSLRMVSCRNCFHLKYWNAPTYTCVSIWRFRKWIYSIKEERKKRKKREISLVSKSKDHIIHLHISISRCLAVFMPTGNRSNANV